MTTGRLVANTQASIIEITHDLCFSSSQYFATVFRRETGMTPGEYRGKHQQKGTTHRRGFARACEKKCVKSAN
jgi:AraC-like DNA-binding protein